MSEEVEMVETKLEDVKEDVEEEVEKGRDAVGGDGGDGLAKRVLVPAAAGVGTLAATYAARKAPDLVRERLLPKLEERGGEEAAAVGKHAARRLQGEGGSLGKVAGKAAGKLGGGGGDKTRRLPIQRWTDVAVPVATAYERWTELEKFPEFMHRVLSVQQRGDDRVSWQEKIWFSTRKWEGQITERKKNDRIAWKTVSGMSHAGVVSFHPIGQNLTRVMVTIDFQPNGVLEKLASGLRFAKRAVQADLARFKAYVELGEAEGLEYKSARPQSEDGRRDDRKPRNRELSDRARLERAGRREQRRS